MKSFFVESFSKRRKREQLYRRSLASTEKIIRHVSLMNNFQRSFHISWNARNEDRTKKKSWKSWPGREKDEPKTTIPDHQTYIYMYMSLYIERYFERNFIKNSATLAGRKKRIASQLKAIIRIFSRFAWQISLPLSTSLPFIYSSLVERKRKEE